MSDEGALEKSGAELFKELLRFYPTAEVEDYFKNGQWKDEVMKVDLQLVEAHRREAGAPDATPLDEVVVPPLPKVFAAMPGMGMGIPGGVRPMGQVGVPMRPAGVITPTGAVGAAGAAAAGGPIAELRLIALFVAKWKLDPTKTKMMLAKMTPQRRRYVIQNFKTTAGGPEATTALEQYITECETTDAWGAASATPVAGGIRPTAGLTPQTVAAGVKRPLLAATNPAATRPRITPVATITPKAGTVVSPQSVMAARMAAAGGVRPATIRPGIVPARPGMVGVRPAMVPNVRPAGRGW